MPDHIKALFSALLILALAVGPIVVSGCKTTSSQSTEVQAASLGLDSEDLAYAGAAFAMSKDASLRDDFTSARVSLERLASLPTLTPADVIAVLSPVIDKVKELRGPRGALIIAGARIILRRTQGESAIETPIYVREVAAGVARGFAAALR